MNSKIYYVNTSITPEIQKINKSENYNYRSKRLTNPNISFDHRYIAHQIENQKFPKIESSIPINYFFRREEIQPSFISENLSNYQYSRNEQKIQSTKLKKSPYNPTNKYILPNKNFIINIKKSENIFSNQQQKDNQHPINYGYYESKYSKKNPKNIEKPQQDNELKTNNNINNNIIKTHNHSIINPPFYEKTISDLNFYRFPSVSNNDSNERHIEYNPTLKKCSQISRKHMNKKKTNNSYICSDFVCFSPIKQELENSSFIRETSDIFAENNQSFSIISRKNTKFKSGAKISTTNKKKLSFQIDEKEINKNLFNVNKGIKGLKIKNINKTTQKINNSKNSKTKPKCQNFNLELKNFGANSQTISYENSRNKSHNISNKRVNSNNVNNKTTSFNRISKIISPHKNKIVNDGVKIEIFTNQNINNYIRDNKFNEDDEIYSYENITEPYNENIYNENEKNKLNDFKSDNKKNSFKPILYAKEHIIQKKIISNKENEKIKNKFKIDENSILKKNNSSKIKPFDFNKANKEKNKTSTNKKKEEKNLSNTNLINTTDTTINKNNTIINTNNTSTKKIINTKKYSNNNTEPKNNHTYYEPPPTENLEQYSRLTISNRKTKSKKFLPNNAKRSRINFEKYENYQSNQKEDEWDKVQYLGMRKSTYDPGKRANKRHSNDLNSKFSSTNYIKACEAVSIPGKNEHGFKKTNQDTYLIERNINGILNFNIFGVLDGHGKDGHFASQFVSRYIIYRIKNHPKIKYLDEPNEIYHIIKENGYKIIANIFIDADNQIQKEKFDFYKSGTTCVIVIQLEEHLICANSGDSRAILVFDENYDDNLINSKIYCLSYDCKPNLPIEKKRIYESGGTVEKALDENDEETGPFRVWAKDEDYPGLAMSRSIGDIEAKKYGVIPNPQIVEYTLNYYSKYMIICSDGVWEFIDNNQAMKIGNKYYLRNDPNGLCQELIHQAIDYWLNDDIVIDDITVVTVFF